MAGNIFQAGGRVARVRIRSLRILLDPQGKSAYPLFLIQNNAEAAPGSAFWCLGLGFDASFSFLRAKATVSSNSNLLFR
jgi:hypothetical protein